MKLARPFLMPKLGLTMTEGLVAEWRIGEGDRFAANDVLVVIETDKVAHEIEAPADGHLLKIIVPAGDTVPVSTELGKWSLDGFADASSEDAGAASAAAQAATDGPAPAQGNRNNCAETPSVERELGNGGFVKATPLARRLARQGGISLLDVTGTGPGARIVAEDVRTFALASAQAGAQATGASCAGTPNPPVGGDKITAVQLLPAQRDIPHFHLAVDVEISALLSLRQRLNDLDGPDVGVTHLLIAAVVKALRAAPQMNRVWLDQGIVTFDRIDVGVAVDTQRGWLNPIVRDLGGSSFFDLVRKVDETIEMARTGRLGPDDMHGGAMTIANAGMHDVRYMIPVIPPGQSGIIGVGTIQDCFRPDADGNPELRRELGLVFSADHRVNTELSGLEFVGKLRAAIAAPLTLLAGY